MSDGSRVVTTIRAKPFACSAPPPVLPPASPPPETGLPARGGKEAKGDNGGPWGLAPTTARGIVGVISVSGGDLCVRVISMS